MAGITKQELLALTDSQTKQVPVGANGAMVTIRRLKLKERNALLAGRKVADDPEQAMQLSKSILAQAMVEPTITAEEVDDLPASLVDELARQVMDFNGWTKEGQAAIADHFRDASGAPV